MRGSQLNQILDAELGPDWTSKLTSFDYEPIVAASMGQVIRHCYIVRFNNLSQRMERKWQ
ncbi:hypothetical protein CIPAW_07G126900 [Carya illinoinensis]|uniref:ABC1 atypical kinase-like domain-containing protein n=1 Tax=Carya illinoinensis TaxID=32201 RepID=A0A8T1Q520_CARIL|nr:hypothetical protein CIPAW_07G126900 [Carya illinoinensis]